MLFRLRNRRGEFTKCCLVETDGISLLIFVIAPGKVF